MKLRIGLFVFAAMLLAAHFLRGGQLVAVALCLLAPLLFLHRRRWVLIVLQVAAYVASVAWIAIAVHLVAIRWHYGRPWIAAVSILGVVTLLTLAAGLLLNSPSIKARYPR